MQKYYILTSENYLIIKVKTPIVVVLVALQRGRRSLSCQKY